MSSLAWQCMQTLYMPGIPVWHSEELILPKMKKEIDISEEHQLPLPPDFKVFLVLKQNVESWMKSGHRTFLQGNKRWFLLLCFWVLIQQRGCFCGRSHLGNYTLGETVDPGSEEIFVHAAPWKWRTSFCLLGETCPHLTACKQATGLSSS